MPYLFNQGCCWFADMFVCLSYTQGVCFFHWCGCCKDGEALGQQSLFYLSVSSCWNTGEVWTCERTAQWAAFLLRKEEGEGDENMCQF